MPSEKDRDGDRRQGANEDTGPDDGNGVAVRPFWSGTITFGLVSIPVNLYPAVRSERVSLRMLDRDGTPLSRRYFCPEEDREVARDEIVRGYEIEPGEFVVVTDEELERLEPEKTRDIDLQRFVDVNTIDPAYFRRSYFLAPTRPSAKAYRLLADTMERTGRAGVATFVMRGKEYLVAILAENGILQAETLRFQDELRDVAEIGLPEAREADRKRTAAMEKAIRGLTRKGLSMAELEDRQTERLRKLIQKKKRQRSAVIEAPAEAVERMGEIVDLMEVLKQRLRGEETALAGRGAARGQTRGEGAGRRPPRRADRATGGGRRDTGGDDLTSLSKQELYERAQALDISGRSGMSKNDLIRAIRRAS